MSAKAAPKKVVLAYSGGLDTSIILKWLQTEYGCEVVTFTADLGQGEELEPARQKAILLGIKPENIHIVDVREEFVRDFVFPMFRANALYEGLYLLGTSIARPLISQHLVRIVGELERVRQHDQVHGVLGERQPVRVGDDLGRRVVVERPARRDAALREEWARRQADLQRVEPEDVGDGLVEVRLLAREQVAAEVGREPLRERRCALC